jgi:diadenosine tetraphosphate (Ap4A) HIT family hydrolase
MTSLFSRIIVGEEPARFVWADPDVVAFLTIAPLTAGHTLVVPRQEIDHWTDAAPGVLGRCVEVAQRIGQALQRAYDAPRAGLVIAGYEVPHMHVHVFASWSMRDFDWSAVQHPSAAALDEAAERVRAGLATLPDGH